jgi:hypothetical protein
VLTPSLGANALTLTAEIIELVCVLAQLHSLLRDQTDGLVTSELSSAIVRPLMEAVDRVP